MKKLLISLIFIFPNFYSWNTTQKTSVGLSSVVKKKIWMNKRLNLEFPYFFNTLCKFCQILYFFKILKTDFTTQYLFNTFKTAWEHCTGLVITLTRRKNKGHLGQRRLDLNLDTFHQIRVQVLEIRLLVGVSGTRRKCAALSSSVRFASTGTLSSADTRAADTPGKICCTSERVYLATQELTGPAMPNPWPACGPV